MSEVALRARPVTAMDALGHPVLWVLLVLLGLTGLWQLIGAPIGLITQIAIYTLYGAGVCLLVSYTGLVPFGASVFFGCASYAVAFVMLRGGANEIVGLAFCTVFSLVLAAVIALIILRRRGLYFSLLTLAFSQIAFEIAYKWTGVTGGENGLQGVRRPIFTSAWSFHVFVVVTVCLGMGLLWRIAHSPFGRSLQALRDNEQRAQSLGYNVFRLKFLSFVLMGGVVGYSGGLLAFMINGAYADNLSWQHAGDSLLMAVLGGVHHFLGPLWGAIAFILLEDRLSAITESWWLMFAPIVILFALASPEGMQGLVFRLMGREDWTLTRKRIPPWPAHIAPFRAHGAQSAGAQSGAELDEARPILTVTGLSKRFGSLVTAADLNLEVYPYQLHSFIGPNGAGKTTFFNMLTGILRPNAGRIVFDGHDITGL
ncbi:MAG TPA: ATP-binding cassette domain-containing protein, partial [Rhodopila sp.]|nr:ATP-binding cassette domain-containing protein [Rhodopila sp.]